MGSQTQRIVEVADLVVDPALQPRVSGVEPGHVASLAEDPGGWPPLSAVERDGALLLVDGFHRYAAAEQLGLATLQVELVEAPADGDLRALAFAANVRHGRPLSLGDRKAEAARLLKREPASSDREIARRCGLAQPTVATVRTALEAGAQIEHLPVRIGADSKMYPAPKRKPGELPAEGLGEAIGRGISGLVSGREASQRRRTVSYLERVAQALADQFRLPDWAPAALAEAALSQLDEAGAAELAVALGSGALNLLRVARLLGYEDGET